MFVPVVFSMVHKKRDETADSNVVPYERYSSAAE
jgi:hypothetical protein